MLRYFTLRQTRGLLVQGTFGEATQFIYGVVAEFHARGIGWCLSHASLSFTMWVRPCTEIPMLPLAVFFDDLESVFVGKASLRQALQFLLGLLLVGQQCRDVVLE
jgi:hypothetical protein